MHGKALPLTEFITGIRQFVIPVFQRAYSWTEDHCAQLWHDVLNASRSGSKHFFGAAVVIPTTDGTRHLVVDGQQRLTTVLLLLVALRNRIGGVRWPGCPSAASIDADFLRDRLADAYAGDSRYKLLLRGPDHDTLRRLLDGSEPARGTSRALDVAHDYFAKSITNEDPAVIWRGVQQFEIIKVRLKRGVDDPQAVFESLNSTGMALRTSDLVRNFILMGLDEPQQTHLYDLHWSELDRLFKGNEAVFDDFIRDYMDMTTGRKIPTRSDRIYRDFRRFWRTSVDRDERIDSSLTDMVRHARNYTAFRLGRDDRNEHDERRRERYTCIRRNSAAPAITIMRLLAWRESVGPHGERDLLESLSLIESFLVRRAVCRSGSRSYGRVFATLAARIGSALRGTPALTSLSRLAATAEPLQETLRSPLAALRVALYLRPLGHDFPSDEDFGKSLQRDEMYHKHVCKFLLDRLQNHGNKEQVDTEKLQIEHILPQNPNLRTEWTDMLGDNWEKDRDRCLHRLGNLTLTGYNPDIRDFPFREKVQRGFLRSSLGKLNRLITDQTVWDADAIMKRTRNLATQALGIWPALRVEESSLPYLRLRQRIDDSTGRDKLKIVGGNDVILERLRERMLTRLSGFVEIPERSSISYHRPRYFLEVVPMTGRIRLLMALAYEAADDPTRQARDLDAWRRVRHSAHKQQSGTIFDVSSERELDAAMHLIEQAYRAAE